LNKLDNMCIPEPGQHAPGVFLGVAAAWVIFMLIIRQK